MLPARDAELVQIVDAALADASERARRPEGDSWLSCRPGCTSCCHGVFRISALDRERLRTGLETMARRDALRAAAVQTRAQALAATLRTQFPGDPETGVLAPEDPRWDAFADLPEADAACPALDPATGRCDLYVSRPLTCRIFGPPVRNDEGIGMCELCYIGAPESAILHGEMFLEHHALEEELIARLSGRSEPSQNETVIAWALLP